MQVPAKKSNHNGRSQLTKKCTGVAVRRFSLHQVTRGNPVILVVIASRLEAA